MKDLVAQRSKHCCRMFI